MSLGTLLRITNPQNQNMNGLSIKGLIAKQAISTGSATKVIITPDNPGHFSALIYGDINNSPFLFLVAQSSCVNLTPGTGSVVSNDTGHTYELTLGNWSYAYVITSANYEYQVA